ncbi:MAG: D-alanyl-D-alanine carboxypeptidase [Sphingobacteriia bacterium]|jgi:D-alanyl-D-alanine carboxypeptidase/D-alanyl-D-alanine-endopeptidase (penicillin-binding protein 4)
MRHSILLLLLTTLLVLSACSVQKKAIVDSPTSIASLAKTAILDKADFAPAHVGISIYDPSENKFLFSYQDTKYFVPASNTKLFTCFAALKNLKDSLVAFEYLPNSENTAVRFTGDPTFLHPDFKQEKVFNYLQANAPNITFVMPRWNAASFGNGWAWNDYDANYMPERSAMPIYSNLVWFSKKGNQLNIVPKAFKDSVNIFASMADGKFAINRDKSDNHFEIVKSNRTFTATQIPFTTKKSFEDVSLNLLEDTLNRVLHFASAINDQTADWKKFYSQPTDSMLKLMMHESDNFFAEQTLLMVGNEKIGLMDDNKIIDTLLKSDFLGLPQKPKWVDGSGLSRYNLMTPQDFVWILTQMKKSFSWERINTILPGANEGTLAGLYKGYEGKIFAKTGTLSNHVALSGYITTKKGTSLIFSVLVNAHQAAAGTIRKSIEQFITGIIDNY